MNFTQRGFGLEYIERQVKIILFQQLNAELDAQEELWYELDKEYVQITGNELGKTTLEHIPDENFYSGHRPSLLTSGPEGFPNIAVMCYTGVPIYETDQTQSWVVDIDIEIMVRSFEGEEEVNRRIKRTVEAVNQVMMRNDSLNGCSLGFNGDPDVLIVDTYKQNSELSHGEDWWWTAARIGYNINRHSKLPLGA